MSVALGACSGEFGAVPGSGGSKTAPPALTLVHHRRLNFKRMATTTAIDAHLLQWVHDLQSEDPKL